MKAALLALVLCACVAGTDSVPPEVAQRYVAGVDGGFAMAAVAVASTNASNCGFMANSFR